jgi:hypothetical protein
VIQDIWWVSIWVISGGSPFQWTVNVSVGGRDVTAEATLSKLVLPYIAGDKWAKAAVLSAQYGPTTSTGTGVQQSSRNWGIDGPPVQYLPNCSWMQFALEVNGYTTFAYMTGKIYVH